MRYSLHNLTTALFQTTKQGNKTMALSRRGFLLGGAAAAAAASFGTAAAAKNINTFGTNIAVQFINPDHAETAKVNELIHRIFRDGLQTRYNSTPRREGPNNSGFERAVAREIQNYRLRGSFAEAFGVRDGTKLETLIAENGVQVWENQENRLPAPRKDGLLHIELLVHPKDGRRKMEFARGFSETNRGACYAGTPRTPDGGTTTVRAPLCPGGI